MRAVATNNYVKAFDVRQKNPGEGAFFFFNDKRKDHYLRAWAWVGEHVRKGKRIALFRKVSWHDSPMLAIVPEVGARCPFDVYSDEFGMPPAKSKPNGVHAAPVAQPVRDDEPGPAGVS